MIGKTWSIAHSSRRLQKHLATCHLLLAMLLFAGCQSEPLPPPAETPLPTTAVLQIGVATGAERFAELTTVVYQPTSSPINVISGSESTLLADLASNQLDAILVHQLPESSENWFNPVALDGLVIVVHPDNPVSALSSGQVQALFNGRITNWSALGGEDQPVTLFVGPPGSGARAILAQRIMAEQRVTINAQIAPENAALLAAVATNPAAVGLSFMGTAVDAPVKMLVIDGVAATPTTTGTQQYPLTIPLYFVSLTEPTGPPRDFLALVQSPAGQAAISQIYGRVR